jgi:L-lactate dehydrogenase complex protein LldG
MSRDRILADIRRALEPREHEPMRRRAVQDRLDHAAAHLSLARTRLPPAALLALFKAHIAALGADLIEVAAPLTYRRSGLPQGAPAAAPSRWQRSTFVGACRDQVGGLTIDHARRRRCWAIARRRWCCGLTLVLASGPHNPVTLAFVPDTHLVVVSGETIVPGYEQAAELVRAEMGGNGLPRTLNLVTGASRTGDIGGRIVMGAHGPRRLAVILVAGA